MEGTKNSIVMITIFDPIKFNDTTKRIWKNSLILTTISPETRWIDLSVPITPVNFDCIEILPREETPADNDDECLSCSSN